MNGYIAKILTKVAASVLYGLQSRHSIFGKADALELGHFVLQIYSSAPAHIKLALGALSVYINFLGLLLFFKPVTSLNHKQVCSLVDVMDGSPIGAVRAYARFFSNIAALGALSEQQYVP